MISRVGSMYEQQDSNKTANHMAEILKRDMEGQSVLYKHLQTIFLWRYSFGRNVISFFTAFCSLKFRFIAKMDLPPPPTSGAMVDDPMGLTDSDSDTFVFSPTSPGNYIPELSAASPAESEKLRLG